MQAVAGLVAIVTWLPALAAAADASADRPSVAVAGAAIQALEERVRRDPEDFIALNELADSCLQRLRETGDTAWLARASRAARASLAALPAQQNPAGLNLLAQSAYASHDFVAARDHALHLTQLQPGQAYAWMTLVDALLELGDYDAARDAIRRMDALAAVGPRARLAAAQRIARVAALHGDVGAARARLDEAVSAATAVSSQPHDALATSRAQLGELELAEGDAVTAERHARAALDHAPGMTRALALLGRSRAAQGDVEAAIEQFRSAVSRLPDPGLLATLGDLYGLAGRPVEAARQYALVAAIGRLRSGTCDRQLATYYADHDLDPEAAYSMAECEYRTRRDIHGADTLAWTALKSGRVDEAQAAIAAALRLGTRDARFWYHAGMIARASGDAASARAHLERAIALSPRFDPLQATLARQALDSLPPAGDAPSAGLVQSGARAR